MKPVTSFTKHEKIVLKSLALNGQNNINAISELEQITYVSTHRSVRSLNRRKLIWLVKIGDRGPTSAQTFSLTPLGLIASIIFCDLWESINLVLENYRMVSPLFIRFFNKYVEQGLESALKQAAHHVYYDSAFLVKEYDFEKEVLPLNSIKIRRNSLDVHFFTAFLRTQDMPELEKIIPIITFDNEYLQAWRKWNSIQRLKNNYREMINKEISENIPGG